MNLLEVRDAAPAVPLCFTRESWVGYLLDAQNKSKTGRKPFTDGVYRTNFNFCNDCDLLHASVMARADRCNPSIFRVIPIKEVSYECV
jgi:hypothetical protein